MVSFTRPLWGQQWCKDRGVGPLTEKRYKRHTNVVSANQANLLQHICLLYLYCVDYIIKIIWYLDDFTSYTQTHYAAMGSFHTLDCKRWYFDNCRYRIWISEFETVLPRDLMPLWEILYKILLTIYGIELVTLYAEIYILIHLATVLDSCD